MTGVFQVVLFSSGIIGEYHIMKCLLLLLLFLKPYVSEGNATLNYADHYENFHSFIIKMNEIRQKGLVQDIFSNLERDNSTDKCSQDLRHYRDSLDSHEEWAISLIDSSGISSMGLISGNIISYGNYKQCLSTSPKNFSSSYCIVKFSIPKNPDFIPWISSPVTVRFMLCLPDTCNDEKVETLLAPLTSENNSSVAVECYSKRPGFTLGNIFTMSLFILIWIMIISTAVPKKWIPIKNGVFYLIWDSFNFRRNLAISLKTKSETTPLSSLQGLRVLSILVIVWGHVLYSDLKQAIPVLNRFTVQEINRSWLGSIVAGTIHASDSFFVIGGILMTWTCLEKKRKFNLILYYAYRYLRLTPAYLATILIILNFYNKLCDGPLCNTVIDRERQMCASYWWTNLLYINNIYPTELTRRCMDHSWFLAVDWQLFFFISPFVVIVINKCPQHLYKLLNAIVLTSVILSFLASYFYHLPTWISLTDDYYTKLYMTPYWRAGPWAVGMFCGAFLHNAKKNPVKLSKKVRLIAWLLTLIGVCISFQLEIAFLKFPSIEHSFWSALFNACHPTIWAASLCWIIFASETQQAGFIGRFLRWPVLQPLASLTFTTYLIHMMIINLYLADSYGYNNITATTQIPLALGITVLTYAAAFLLFLSIEAPTTHLINILYPKETLEKQNITGKEEKNSKLEITTIKKTCIQELEPPNKKINSEY